MKVKVFQFRVVSNDYMDLLPDDRRAKTQEEKDRINAALEFNGEPKGDFWIPPPVFAEHPRRPMPDIWNIDVGSGAFAVGPKVLDEMSMFLEMAGELLPLPYKNLELTICNITECVDCIDPIKSELQVVTPEHRILRKVAFYPEYLPVSTLFKIPEWPWKMLCWERTGDPEEEFKAFVESKRYKGGHKGNFFELLWESPD